MEGRRGKLLDSIAIGARLKATRQALGLNQRELCRETGIGEAAYNQYELGNRPLTIVAALLLCERFGLTLDWLYRGDRSGLPLRITTRLQQFTLGIETVSQYLSAAEADPEPFIRRPRRPAKSG